MTGDGINTNPRQAMILKLIQEEEIDKQEELVRRLNETGFNVTQATVSRDIKYLHLTKVPTASGKSRYAIESTMGLVASEEEKKVVSTPTGSGNQRHSMILKLIQEEEIEKQEELVQRLIENGFIVTQATVSRDIKTLHIVKAQTASGRKRFVVIDSVNSNYGQRLEQTNKSITKEESQIMKLPSESDIQKSERKTNPSKDFVVAKGVLKRYRGSAKEVIIPNTVERISEYAFYKKEITNVIIPNSVTEIGEAAFEDCIFIKGVTIPGSVKKIGKHAFYHCKNLSSVVLQEGIEVIEQCAFSHCNNLQAITIPNSIKRLGKKAFSACAQLVDVSLPERINHIDGDPFGSCKGLFDEKGFIIINNRLYGYYGTDSDVFVPEGVIGIEDQAVAYEFGRTYKFDLYRITLPKSVISVGKYAFGGWRNLESVRILGSNVSIKEGAFNDCSRLTEFSSLGDIQSLGKKAFSGCRSLQTFSVLGNIRLIGERSFNGCSSLQSFSTAGDIQSIGEGAFSGCQLMVKDVKISTEAVLKKDIMRTGLLHDNSLVDEEEVSEAISLYEKCMLQINKLMKQDRTYNDPTVKDLPYEIRPIRSNNVAAKAFFQRIAEDYRAGRRLESYDYKYDPDTLLKFWLRTSRVEDGHIGFCFVVGILVASYMFESSCISGCYTFVRDKWEYRGDYSMKTRLRIELATDATKWKIYMEDGYEERDM